MTSMASRLLNLLVWFGMLMIIFDAWGPAVSLLLTALEWLAANPTWVPPVSLYLACVMVKSYLAAQSVPLMTKAIVRYAGLRSDANRDSASMTLACVVWAVLLLFVAIPFMIQERSRFWCRYTRREIIEAARQDDWMMRCLKRVGRWDLARRP
jgi:hypothetical protein